ncbi:hypothetical protein LWF01_16405 [Saxibacter everestensis]|uniref:DUF4190 domain-containing protein n=1 Tax=Saxibacter everestensis TaxID=2909229 RepID=A0ABY8QRN9_9MICO|nr:hypothetical protein LWF01_16405 [Brevibacteriaceae bacterium ZFBP1038]
MQVQKPEPERGPSSLPLISLVLGIGAVLFSLLFVQIGLLIGIGGAVLSVLAFRNDKAAGLRGTQSLLALALNIAGAVLCAVFLITV